MMAIKGFALLSKPSFLKKVTFFILLTSLSYCAYSQKYSTKTISSSEELNSNGILNLMQDSKGFTWIGTEYGISQFDGKRFNDFREKGIILNNVESIIEDIEGNIWFASNKDGIVKYDRDTFQTFSFEGEYENKINCIFEDSKGTIWAASKGLGILQFIKTRFNPIALPVKTFNTIEEDKNGNLYFGSDSGLYIYNNKQVLNHIKLPSKGSIYSLKKDKDDNIWIGSNGNGLFRYRNNALEHIPIPEIEKDVVYDIYSTNDNILWIATGNNGLIKYNTLTNTYDILIQANGLSSNSITSLTQDNEHNIWIGTLNSGLCILNLNGFSSYTKESDINFPEIGNICQVNGQIVFSTFNDGVYVLIDKKIKHPVTYKQLNNSTIITTLVEGSKLWLGTTNGIYIYENEKVKKIELSANLDSRAIVSILKDKKGAIWIATYGGGLFKYDAGKLTNFTTTNGLPTNDIYTAFIDDNHNFWMGTFQHGIVKYDGEKFTQYSHEKHNVPNSPILCICQDKIGNLYLGTEGGGISCYDGKTFTNLSRSNGLSSEYVYSLGFDKNDYLWLGTNKGLNKIKLTSSFKIESIKHYTTKDGLCGNDITQNGFYFNKDGLLWIATNKGASVYNTLVEVENKIVPKLWISEVLLNNETVDWSKYADSIDARTQLPVNLKLKYDQNNLDFKFQALSIQSVKFSYMLDGDEKGSWSAPTDNTERHYENLRPGNYTFKLRAQNNDGYWSKEPYTFSFIILENPWETSLAYSGYATIAILGGIGLFRWQTRRLAKRNKILEVKVHERTQELSIAHNKLSYAYNDIKDSIQYAKQIQDALLPVQDELNKLIPESFILYKPRDVVSGDFYWFAHAHDKIYVASVDCTGHGVPGAFMSMIGNTLLNEIIAEGVAQSPALILNQLEKDVRKSLKQDKENIDSKDGMDLALVALSNKSMSTSAEASVYKLDYSGAKRPLYIVRKNEENKYELTEIKPDKLSIGGMQLGTQTQFTNHEIELTKGDNVYIFSDGFVDQFGGEKGKKITSKRLQELLLTNAHLPMKEQKEVLNRFFETWRGYNEQIDDVLVIGIRV